MKRVLLTGIDGFIGHHVAEGILKDHPDWEIVGLSRIDGASTLQRLFDMEEWRAGRSFWKRVQFQYHNLRAPINEYLAQQIGPIDIILHLAASTHVDRSIEQPMEFVQDNVVATCNILDYARSQKKPPLFVYFSTDEVFGPAPEGTAYKEWDRYNSGNPYSATKAGGEELALAYNNTYKLPLFITHTMNVFGERQHPEKFIPKTIKAVLKGEMMTIHSNSDKTKAGSRFYIHARNVAEAMLYLLDHYKDGDKYNIVGEKEVDNLEMAQFIAKTIGRPLKFEMVDFHSSRPGHDLRYALDGAKLKEMGFDYPKTFEESLEKTIFWYLEHADWLLDDEAAKEASIVLEKHQKGESVAV